MIRERQESVWCQTAAVGGTFKLIISVIIIILIILFLILFLINFRIFKQNSEIPVHASNLSKYFVIFQAVFKHFWGIFNNFKNNLKNNFYIFYIF